MKIKETLFALALLAGAAQMAAQGKQGSGCNVNRIRTQCDGLDDICGIADGTANNNGYVVADALITQTLVNRSQSELNRDTYVIADTSRGRTRAAAESIDCDDIRTASCNTACNSGNIVNSGNLYDNRLFIFCCLL